MRKTDWENAGQISAEQENIDQLDQDNGKKADRGKKSQARAILILAGITLMFFTAVSLGLVGGLRLYENNKTALAAPSPDPDINLIEMALPMGETVLEDVFARLRDSVEALALSSGVLVSSIAAERERDNALVEELAALARAASNNKNLSDTAYENIIVSRLGESIHSYKGKNAEIMIFELKNEDLRGYMAKVKLKSSSALKFTIAPEKSAAGESTSQAAKRLGAKFAVNGGGFAWGTVDGNRRMLPLGNTMIDGKLIGDFQPSWNDLAFVGFTKQNKLVGGVFDREDQLKECGAYQGVSFVPVLVKDWEPVTIPSQWKNSKQPRTVMGQYPNGDIFFIVVDGRQSNWSSGISLEEMQVLLLRLGVMEAYNLDGGGSSAMYYDGKILNKPSDGSERKLSTNIVVIP